MSMNNLPVVPPNPADYETLIELAWREDYRGIDLASQATVPAGQQGRAALVFRQSGILCGMPVVERVLARYDAALRLDPVGADGQSVQAGQTVGRIAGPVRSLLAAERVVLNFLQRLSAIATQTGVYVAAAAGHAAKICDTRKTTPGWRDLEKYAVRCGGGVNHRQGLYDAALIKDNHLASLGAENWVGGVRQAVVRLRSGAASPAFIQVEVDTLEQLQEVWSIDGLDMVLLDNMSLDRMVWAVAERDRLGLKGRVLLEASGGVGLDRVAAIAATGVDRISVGALTHSVCNLDIGLDMDDVF